VAEPLLHDRALNVDRGRVGISYSGAGPLLLVELGVAAWITEHQLLPQEATHA
jgi:hypothetical protein